MSRAAEWRRQKLIMQGKLVDHTPVVEAVAERKNMVPMDCNDQYNLNPLIVKNILESKYFHKVVKLETFHEIVDEIYYRVDHCEPWTVGSQRNPSQCFCLLYKLLLIKVTNKQMLNLLNHVDSPYIRAVGFLYLRYTCPHAQLWKWFAPYINDQEEITPSGHDKRATTVGAWAQTLLEEQKYFSTILPRIPQHVLTELMVNVLKKKEEGKRASANEPLRASVEVGSVVRALFSEDSKWYDARVDSITKEGEFWVTYLPEEEYGNQEKVSIGNLDLKSSASRSSASGNHRARHGRDAPPQSGHGGRRSPPRRSRSAGRGQGTARRRTRSGSYSRSNGRHRRGGRSNSRQGRSRGRQSSSRDRQSRGRRRSRSRGRDGRRGSSDGAAPKMMSEDELRRQVLEQQRNKYTTGGRDFGGRVASLKGSLALKQQNSGVRRRRSRSRERSKPYNPSKSASDVVSRIQEREGFDRERVVDPEKMARREAELAKLKERYGDASAKRQ